MRRRTGRTPGCEISEIVRSSRFEAGPARVPERSGAWPRRYAIFSRLPGRRGSQSASSITCVITSWIAQNFSNFFSSSRICRDFEQVRTFVPGPPWTQLVQHFSRAIRRVPILSLAKTRTHRAGDQGSQGLNPHRLRTNTGRRDQGFEASTGAVAAGGSSGFGRLGPRRASTSARNARHSAAVAALCPSTSLSLSRAFR